jgi:predicted nucleic acid-binding protein
MTVKTPPLLPSINRPDIVIPDSEPLVHLAMVGELGLLHEIGGAVVIVDMVRHEIVQDLAKPGAAELQKWIEDGLAPGTNRPVEISVTETGAAFRLARLVEPEFRMRNAGEQAIINWLGEKLDGTDRRAIVVTENGKVPTAIRRQGIDADIDVLTTRAFLALAEHRQIIASADAIWQRIVAAAPTTNPSIDAFSHRRSGMDGTPPSV